MKRKNPQPQHSGPGCRFIKENGRRCRRQLTGLSKKYCQLHRISGRKQNKARTQKREGHVQAFREYAKEQSQSLNRNHQHRHRNNFTIPKLKPLTERARTRQEACPCTKDDLDKFHQDAGNEIKELRSLVFDSSADLAIAAEAAERRMSKLFVKLQLQQELCPNPATAHFIVRVKELLRDTPKRMSLEAIIEKAGLAKEVRELLHHQEQTLLGLACALSAQVELLRLLYLANLVVAKLAPGRLRRLKNQARKVLDSTKHVCKQAVKHYTGTYKESAFLLGCYIAALEGTLACDDNEQTEPANREEPTEIIKELERLSNKAADYATDLAAEKNIRFTCLIHQAEFCMRSNNTAAAEQYFQKSEDIFPGMQWRSIEALMERSYVKAGLALARGDSDRQKDVQEYVSLFQRHPFLTHSNHLRELKRLHAQDVDESLFRGIPIYFDPMFRRLHPAPLHIYGR
jgi:hypothetical protein